MTTPTERGARAVAVDYDLGGNEVAITRAALDAALDRDEIARVLYGEGTWCGTCTYEGWDACADCRRTVRQIADALIAHLTGSGP